MNNERYKAMTQIAERMGATVPIKKLIKSDDGTNIVILKNMLKILMDDLTDMDIIEMELPDYNKLFYVTQYMRKEIKLNTMLKACGVK